MLTTLKKFQPYQITLLSFFLCLIIWITLSLNQPVFENYPSYFNSNLIVYGKGLPKYMHFCNDTLPLGNLDVKTSIQKEFFESGLIKNKSAISLLFARCERWFPLIEPILKQYQLPNDIKYISVIESHLSNITSPMGAKGFWQLLPQTAQNLGLEVSEYVDERLDVEKSTIAACKYLKQAYNELKNWTLVAAAYNYGINGIKRQIQTQNITSYHQLKLNSETKDFVYRIIAYKILLTYPQHFGIKRKLKTTNKIIFKSINIDSSITNIQFLAQYLNCPKLVLKAFNPWLLNDYLPNPERKSYTFKYPVNTKADYSSYIADLLAFSFNDNDLNTASLKDSTNIKLDSTNLPAHLNSKTLPQ